MDPQSETANPPRRRLRYAARVDTDCGTVNRFDVPWIFPRPERDHPLREQAAIVGE